MWVGNLKGNLARETGGEETLASNTGRERKGRKQINTEMQGERREKDDCEDGRGRKDRFTQERKVRKKRKGREEVRILSN